MRKVTPARGWPFSFSVCPERRDARRIGGHAFERGQPALSFFRFDPSVAQQDHPAMGAQGLEAFGREAFGQRRATAMPFAMIVPAVWGPGFVVKTGRNHVFVFGRGGFVCGELPPKFRLPRVT